MENFSYPIKLEPLNRPLKAPSPQPADAPAARPRLARPAKKRRQIGLKEERERHGVSLKDIADHTRIPLRHLQELERGDVSNWPAGVYARSWAREYAQEAGIDPDRVIAIVAPIAAVEPTIDEIKHVREEREHMALDESPLAPLVQLMRKFAAVAVVLVLLALAALMLWRGDSRAEQGTGPAPVGTSGTAPATVQPSR